MKNIVYVGMDVHSEDNCMAVYLDDRGEPEYESTIPNNEAMIRKFFTKWYRHRLCFPTHQGTGSRLIEGMPRALRKRYEAVWRHPVMFLPRNLK